MHGLGAGKTVHTELPAQHAFDVAVENCRPAPEGEGGNGRRGRPADAWQIRQLRFGFREFSGVDRSNLLGATMQVARPGVIAEARPVLDDGIDRRRGKRLHIGKTGQKSGVIRDHGADLSLLQHDLGQPDAVRVLRPLPGQVVAPGGLLPGDQVFGKTVLGGQILPRRGLREHG